MIANLVFVSGLVYAHDNPTALLNLDVSQAEPGDTITVEGSGFRVGTDASFIYSSTITIGGRPIAGVASVDQASGYLHAARTNDSGLYIAEHIDIDPANTKADGAFSAQLVLPDDLQPGDYLLEATSCWAGPDGLYPEDGVAPCGTEGLGGGVNDYIARALITILEPSTAELNVDVGYAEPGDTITVEGSGFRVGTDASFIYSSTITIGGRPIASVASVDQASGYLHAARTNDSGLYIAEHIDIDPADTEADGAFSAQFVLPDDLQPGEHYLEAISCWGGPDDGYPEDGVAPCGTEGLGGGVNDHIARVRITILEPSTAELNVDVSYAEPGDTITVEGSGFRVGTEASFIYSSTIAIGGRPIASVASVDQASGYLHAARINDSGLYIAEHIDIDPTDTEADGAFSAQFVLPDDLEPGKHLLEITSCWGGPDEAYPEDGVAPCGSKGLGGGVNDRLARAMISIVND